MSYPAFAHRGGVHFVAAILCWAAFEPLELRAAHMVRPVAGFFAEFTGVVRGVGLQPDGRILVVGYLQAGEPPEDRHLIRLHGNGRFDPSYRNPSISLGPYNQAPFAVDAQGRALLVRHGTPPTVLRLLPDGQPDSSWTELVGFEPPAGGEAVIRCLVALRDGSLLVGGTFAFAGGEPRQCAARLTPNGELDPAFNAASSIIPRTDEFPQPVVTAAAEDGEGNLWIVGSLALDGSGENLIVIRAANGEVLRIEHSPDRIIAAPATGVVTDYAVVLPDGSTQPSRPNLVAGAVLPGTQDMLMFGDTGGITDCRLLRFEYSFLVAAEQCSLGFKLTADPSHILPVGTSHFLAAGGFESTAYFRDYRGGNPKGIDRLPNGNLIVCDGGSVVEYDLNGNIIRHWQFPILGDPQGIAYDPQRDRFYMLDNDFEALFVFDGDAQFVRALDTRSLGIDEPEGIEVHPASGNLLLVDDRWNRLFELTEEGELLGSVGLSEVAAEQGLLASGAEGLAFDAANDRLFISFDEANWVGEFRFTPSDPPLGPAVTLLSYFHGTGNVLKRGGDGIAYDPETDHLWMVCSKWNRIAEMTLDGQPVQGEFSSGLARFELVPFEPPPGSRFLGSRLDGDAIEVEMELEPQRFFTLGAAGELPVIGKVKELQTIRGSLAPQRVRIQLNPDESVKFFRISE